MLLTRCGMPPPQPPPFLVPRLGSHQGVAAASEALVFSPTVGHLCPLLSCKLRVFLVTLGRELLMTGDQYTSQPVVVRVRPSVTVKS